MRSISALQTEPAVTVSEAALSGLDAWDRYVRAHEGASVYHLAGWRDVIETVFGRETHYLLAERAGRVCGVLPLVRLKSLVFGDFLVSMPYVNYGGVLADDAVACTELLHAAASLAEGLGVNHVELRHLADCAALPKRQDKVSMHLKLRGDADALWQRLGSKRRAQIKRSQKEGASCEIGGLELLDDFYAVFAVKYRDLGTPVYPIAWFTALLRQFADLTRVFIVRVDGKPVAASIVIGFNGTLEVPWASTLREADRYAVNMYLYWNMLKFAEDQGYRVFDFGRSTVDSGTYRFKKQWGAEPVQHYWHYWLRNSGEIPLINASNPKALAAVAVWKRLPLWLANRLGPHLAKNLP